MGDSLSSGLFVALAILGAEGHSLRPLWEKTSNRSRYLCQELRPVHAETHWANLSWMFYPNAHSIQGYFNRDPKHLWTEFGLPNGSYPPDLVIIQSGLWGVQEVDDNPPHYSQQLGLCSQLYKYDTPGWPDRRLGHHPANHPLVTGLLEHL